MLIIFVICAENVDSDCSILCSSPMSAKTLLKTQSLLLSAAGIIIPHKAISVSKPIVFKDTVFPPVFGPVITKISKLVPNSMSVGTTFSLFINGCLDFFKLIIPSLFIIGKLAFILYASCAFAKTTSNSTQLLKLDIMPSENSPASLDRSASIFSISAASLALNTLISLFNSTTEIGSINTVAPLADES